MFSGSAGRVAMAAPRFGHPAGCQRLAPRAPLRQPEQRAPATRTDVLVVPRTVAHLVDEPELLLDGRQVPDHHGGRVRLAASAAACLLASCARVLVEARG